MALTILAGLPGAGVERALRERVCDAAREGRSALLVVPTSLYASRVSEGLARAHPVGLGVAAVDRVVRSEWSLKGDGRRIADGLCRDILLSASLVEAGVADAPGRGAIALLGALATKACARGVESRPDAPGLGGALLRALSHYRSALADQGLVHPAEAARALAACAPPSDVVGVEGIVAITPDIEAMIVGWSDAGCSIVLALPWREGCAATEAADGLVRRLQSHGGVVEAIAPAAGERPRELQRIVDGLFAGPLPEPGEGCVELGVARGNEAEAALIADRVRELLASGVDAARIAVAFADPASHTGWLRRAFDDAGIEASWEVRTPITQTPLGRSMLHLKACGSGGFGSEELSAFMHSPFSGVDTTSADEADASWRRLRTRGADLLARAGRARPLVEAWMRLRDRPIDPDTAGEWKKLADTLLANAYGRDAPVPGMDGAVDAAVHRAFVAGLSSAAGCKVTVTAKDMWDAFERSAVSPTSPGASGRVTVTSFDGLGGRSLAAVIVGGMTAGEAPREGSDDRLEGDAVLAALAALRLSLDPEEHARAERMSFYLAVTAATGSLTLVRRETDDEGRLVRPSVFWEEFLDLYRAPGSGPDAAALPSVRFRAPDDATISVRGCGADRGALSDTRARAGLSEIDAVSPGEVELYVGCPYRWFVQRRLRPRAADAEIDAMAVGAATHQALAEFYRTWKAGGRDRITADSVDEALTVARRAVAAAIAEAPVPETLDEEWRLASVEPAVLGLVTRDADFLPEYAPKELEWSFGLTEGDEPVDLGGVRVKGRADRIDVGPQGLVVIDYKRGHASSRTDIGRDGLVQLQLYALAASSRMGLPVAGGLYRSLSSGSDRGFMASEVRGAFAGADVVDPETMAEILDRAVDGARSAVAGMRSADIAPSPDVARCPFCLALPFCPEGVRR